MEYNGYRLRTPNNPHSPSATAAKVTAVLSSNHVYLLRTVLYWLKPPYTTARVSVTNVKLCHDLPSGLSWHGRVKLSNKQTHTDFSPTVWDLIWCCWDKGSCGIWYGVAGTKVPVGSDTVLLGQRFLWDLIQCCWDKGSCGIWYSVARTKVPVGSDMMLLGQRFLWDLIWCCWDKSSSCFWRTVAPSPSTVKQILRLLDPGGNTATTTLQHCATSHKTWIHSSALLWGKALTHPQCLCYHLACTCLTLVSSKLNTLNSLHKVHTDTEQVSYKHKSMPGKCLIYAAQM